jgi:hypothetical protein
MNQQGEMEMRLKLITLPVAALALALCNATVQAEQLAVTPLAKTSDLEITATAARYIEELELVVFEMEVAGQAGATMPDPRGRMDGAPVLAYVFPTSLSPQAVGFGPVDGTLALVATSHPDFDDTPLWDESGDGRYDNDGGVFHTHWVVLSSDDRVPGGLSVREFDENEQATLPPTNPGMPMYMDSPGLTVVLRDQTLRILVPAWRIRNQLDFSFDGVTAYLEVNMSDRSRPMLGVYEVYSVSSGDLSLPYRIERTSR